MKNENSFKILICKLFGKRLVSWLLLGGTLTWNFVKNEYKMGSSDGGDISSWVSEIMYIAKYEYKNWIEDSLITGVSND